MPAKPCAESELASVTGRELLLRLLGGPQEPDVAKSNSRRAAEGINPLLVMDSAGLAGEASWNLMFKDFSQSGAS